MTRRLGFILVPVAVMAIALAFMGGTQTQARETAPATTAEPAMPATVAGYRVFECFSVLTSWGEGAFPLRTITLTTDGYGADEVVVTRLAMMCESAIKYPYGETGSGLGGYSVFACYTTIRGQYVGEPLILNTDNFGEDYVFASLSTLMCESATKYHNGEPGGSEPENSSIWQCFKLSGLPQRERFSIETDNFGHHGILVFGATQLCEDAEKTVGGSSYGDYEDPLIQECFSIARLDLSAGFERVTLETENFGEVHAILGRPVMMCEEVNNDECDVSGEWTDGVLPSTAQVAITVNGNTLTGDWLLEGRPDFTGTLSDSGCTLEINFPDDATYAATVSAGTILWSNGSVWTRPAAP